MIIKCKLIVSAVHEFTVRLHFLTIATTCAARLHYSHKVSLVLWQYFCLNWAVEHVLTIITEMRAVCFAHLPSNFTLSGVDRWMGPSLQLSAMPFNNCAKLLICDILAYPCRVCTASHFSFNLLNLSSQNFWQNIDHGLMGQEPCLTILLHKKLPKKYFYLKQNSGGTCTLQEDFISMGWNRCWGSVWCHYTDTDCFWYLS